MKSPRQRRKDARRAAGLCVWQGCKAPPVVGDNGEKRLHCKAHAAKQRAYTARWYAATKRKPPAIKLRKPPVLVKLDPNYEHMWALKQDTPALEKQGWTTVGEPDSITHLITRAIREAEARGEARGVAKERQRIMGTLRAT